MYVSTHAKHSNDPRPMPSHSRSLHAKATEINVSLARKLAALLNLFRKKNMKPLYSRMVQSSGESGLTILRKSTETPSQRPSRATEFILVFICDLHLVYAWGLNLEVFAGVSLQRAPGSILFQGFQQTFVARGLARLPAGAFRSSVGGGLVQ